MKDVIGGAACQAGSSRRPSRWIGPEARTAWVSGAAACASADACAWATAACAKPKAAANVATRRTNPLRGSRSEEHTSELQSPYDLVCRLLLEKKKKTQN